MQMHTYPNTLFSAQLRKPLTAFPFSNNSGWRSTLYDSDLFLCESMLEWLRKDTWFMYALITHTAAAATALLLSLPCVSFSIYLFLFLLSSSLWVLINLLSYSIFLSSVILSATTTPTHTSPLQGSPLTYSVSSSASPSHCHLSVSPPLLSPPSSLHIGTHSGNTLPPFISDNIYQNRQCYR